MAIEGDTRVDVLGPESMTLQSTSVMKMGANEQTIDSSAHHKWLSGDCGEVAPVELNQSVE